MKRCRICLWFLLKEKNAMSVMKAVRFDEYGDSSVLARRFLGPEVAAVERVAFASTASDSPVSPSALSSLP